MSTGSREANARRRRPDRALIVAALLLAGARAVSAVATEDVLAGSRLLKAAAPQALAPAGASAITRDVGAIAVIEHDGSDYSKETGTPPVPNYAPRAAVAQAFYQTHGDFYDFLVVFTNFEFETGDAVAFHNYVRNDVRGINLPVGDNGELFGSNGRLLAYIDMAAIERYTNRPLSVRQGVLLSANPTDEGFRDTLSVLAHEIGHQWLAHVRFKDASGVDSRDLLGKDEAHWSYLLDSDASLMYGSDWTTSGDGVYRASRVREGYSALDRYLMGFLDGSKVPPFTLLRSPSVSALGLPNEGDVVTAVPETITLEQIIAAEGARSPGFAAAPKTFRAGFILLTANGVEPAAEDLAAVERIRQAFVAHFFALTHGAALIETSLAEEEYGEPVPAPDLEKATAWLSSQQALDGHWEDSSWTATRDTVAAFEALAAIGRSGDARSRLWLEGASTTSFDFLARRAIGLAAGTLRSADREPLLRAILSLQNTDGGFGAGAGYASDPLDTVLALRALAALKLPAGPAVRRALACLASQRVGGGGWPAVSGAAEVSAVVTAHALLALHDWTAEPLAQAAIPSAVTALLSRRNQDNGFGESPSTAYATALALQALSRTGAAPQVLDGATSWLHQNQLEDGSWEGSVYATALVLAAVKDAEPNLVVPPDSLGFEPASPKEGELLHVAAQVRNIGRKTAAPSVAHLHDGDPDLNPFLATAEVPLLEAGESATIRFELDTTGHVGDRTLYVVADATRQVAEAREDDNVSSRPLKIAGLLPDLVVDAPGLRVEPYPPEAGETVEIAASVRNAGQGRSPTCILRVILRNGQVSRRLGDIVLPALGPGAGVTLTLPWDTTGRQGDHVLEVTADASGQVPESDEFNNAVALPVQVTSSQSGGVDLEVAAVSISPSALQTLPQAIEVRARVRNLGRGAATSVVAVYESSQEAPLVRQPVELAGRSSTELVFPLIVTSPGVHEYVVRVDPDGSLAETDETNNEARATLTDPGNTHDVEVRSEDVTVSGTDLVLGDTLEVAAVVRNRGTTPFSELPVILGHVAEDGMQELGRQLVSLSPGESIAVSFQWIAAIAGDPLPLVVRADPFGLLPEVSESNNDAAFSVSVRPSALPNLSVRGADISFSPDPPLEGEAAVVAVLVRNPSSVDADSFAVRFFRGDPDSGGTEIGQARVEGVRAGATAVPSISWPSVDARGAQGLYVVADALGEVSEYDEADNRAFRRFAIDGLPDFSLVTADVSLEPGYPREGEALTIRALVRNLGQQPTPRSVVRAYEGPGSPGTQVGEEVLEPIVPGQQRLVEISWTPASPSGERPLAVIVDPDGLVRELDEGNNLARRMVLVQNGELYLTERFFSPNGDGVKDTTTLGYRADTGGTVSIVVSNTQGQKVRTLAVNAPAAGSVKWDGRDDKGRIAWDGTYTLSVEDAGGRALARVEVVLDTNRSSIFDAAGTGLVAAQPLSCELPTWGWRGPEWMPSEQEALFIIPSASGDLTPGLIRVDRSGAYSYVDQADWWASAGFSSPVSPDGRLVLVSRDGGIVAVDTLTGARQERPDLGNSAFVWSPDGRSLLEVGGGVKIWSREGAYVADLPLGAQGSGGTSLWSWAPDGRQLAGWPGLADGMVTSDLVIYGTDGREQRRIALPDSVECVRSVTWRGDDSVHLEVGKVQPIWDGMYHCLLAGSTALIFEPGASTFRSVPDVSARTWSPDGTKALRAMQAGDGESYSTWVEVVAEDGSNPRFLWPNADVTPSPRGSLATFGDWVPPGTGCNQGPGYRSLHMTITSLQNLTSAFTISRLVANQGLKIEATVADAYLDHHQLEYAVAGALDTWYAIGPSSDVPVLNEVLTIWVPPGPGTYVVRLRAFDRAGNMRAYSRVVTWDRRSSIGNISFDEALISPNDDGVKDAVTFRYQVLEPSRVNVRIAGPAPSKEEAGPIIEEFARDYAVAGSESDWFTWSGRYGSGQVVPDGRYTVWIDDLPFRVEVDSTPPDVAVSVTNIHAECSLSPCETPEQRRSAGAVVVGDKSWHIFDPHLKGATPVFEPQRDGLGRIVYDDGVPRPLRIDGRLVDVVGHLRPLRGRDLATVTAEDHAGNRSTVGPLLTPELILVEVSTTVPKETRVVPPITEEAYRFVQGYGQPFDGFDYGLFATVRGSVRFEHRAKGTPTWTAGPEFEAGVGLLTARVMVAALGMLPDIVYETRMVLRHAGGEVPSQVFRFVYGSDCGTQAATCEPCLRLCPTRDGGGLLRVSLDEPVARAEAAFTYWRGGAILKREVVDLVPDAKDPTWYPVPFGDPWCGRVTVAASVVMESGKRYDATHPSSLDFAQGCQDLRPLGVVSSCLTFGAAPEYCSTEQSSALLKGWATGGRFVTIEREGSGEPPVSLDLGPDAQEREDVGFEVRLEGVDRRAKLRLRGRLERPDLPMPVAEHEKTVTFDAVPPSAQIVDPFEEGGRLCLHPLPGGGDEARLTVGVKDAAPQVEVCEGEYRRENGSGMGFVHAAIAAEKVPAGSTGSTPAIKWTTTGLSDGAYAVRVRLCDPDGNSASAERRLWFARTPPEASIVEVLPASRFFSPNGDGRSDSAGVTVRTDRTGRLTVEVRAGAPDGPLVRRLASRPEAEAGDHAFVWDGRDDNGGTVADGDYVFVVAAADPCGLKSRAEASMSVDNTAPLARIVQPAPGGSVRVTADVFGEASDQNLAAYELTYGVGAAPTEWQHIDGQSNAVATGGILGHWLVPASAGRYVLRLVAWDRAENSAEARVQVEALHTDLVGALSVEPSVFSPNGDGRREIAFIAYELLADGRVTLDVVDSEGAKVRSLVGNRPEEAGRHQSSWDGNTDFGVGATDGDYAVRIRVEDFSDRAVYEQGQTEVILDRAPPSIEVDEPALAGVVSAAAKVRGSIQDPHLAAYALQAAPASGGELIPLGVGGQSRSQQVLGSLVGIADGEYRLSITARDQAENETTSNRPFTVDSRPPQVSFESPEPEAVLDKNASPIDVRGAVTDAHLDHYSLDVGSGRSPGAFDPVSQGAFGGESISLAGWAVATLSDGPYTLRLQGFDRAGSKAEALRVVTLDGVAPLAAIESPAEGSYVTAASSIRGTASDANIAAWNLAVAPGDAATAYEWSDIAYGSGNVESHELTSWVSLPEDGVYTLRLTVRDKAGHVSKVLRTLTVDQTPPAAPTGLEGKVVDRTAETSTVRLGWNPNAEPDLGGYTVGRQGLTLTHPSTQLTKFDDAGRTDGEYRYQVFALDKAGNVSKPAETTVEVDLTPPLVEIQRPPEDIAVSGTQEVRGTAWSFGDFAEYRLSVGASATPTSWTLITRSTLPVVSGRLGTWDAMAEGTYVLALEADDQHGNTARVTRSVRVDTTPPAAPELTGVDQTPDATSITSVWKPSASPDVQGYLVYRGARLANAPGVVIGDLRPYLVAGLSFTDQQLPDGEHCYQVVAMDQAGNTSARSNELCRFLDNRTPRATIVAPQGGLRFDFPIRVVADTPDTDIATVQIQSKPHAQSVWSSLGPPQTAPVYDTTLDPATLAPGDYDLRAIATDLAGKADAAPPSITVTYGDTRPPSVPSGLAAHVEGRQVHLAWAANPEADLVGYHVYRDGERITPAPLSRPEYDEERDPDDYVDTVTAVDTAGNESGQSEPAYPHVYQPLLFPPSYPVTFETTTMLAGDGARADTTIEIRSESDAILAAASASEPTFTVPDVPLALDANVVSARGADAAGNTSIPSDTVVVIRNERPASVTGLDATVTARDVLLGWSPSEDADRHGYVVRRDGLVLNASTRIVPTSAVASSADRYCLQASTWVDCVAESAIDDDPTSPWIPGSWDSARSWSVFFPSALLDRVVLQFANGYGYPGSAVVSSYRIEVRWGDRYLPVIRVTGNTQRVVESKLPMPFATDSIRIVVDGDLGWASNPCGVGDVQLWKLDALSGDATSFEDPAVADGYHDYDVRAIDRYGAESGPATLRVAAGDVEPPAAPLELAAMVVGRDVRLTWAAGTEADIERYVVIRNGEQIGTSLAAEYLDAEPPNGQYTYVVRALDRVGNQSPPSNEAVAVVALVLPPPVLRAAAEARGRIALDWEHPGAAGFRVYRAVVSGGPHEELGTTGDVRGYVDGGVTPGVEYFYVVRAFDAQAGESALSNEVAIRAERNEPPPAPSIVFPTDSAHPITIDALHSDVRGGAEAGSLVTLEVNGAPVASGLADGQPLAARTASVAAVPGTFKGVVSPDGRMVASLWNDGDATRITLVDVASGASREVTTPAGQYPDTMAFSPDSRRLAYTLVATEDFDVATAGSLVALDLDTDTTEVLFEGSNWLWEPQWSPDGRQLAFVYYPDASPVARLVVRDMETGALRDVDEPAEGEQYLLRWSPDGASIAYLYWREGRPVELRVSDAATGTSRTLHEGVIDDDTAPSWSPDGRRLAFVDRVDERPRITELDVQSGTLIPLTDGTSDVFGPAYDPTGTWLTYNEVQSSDNVPRRVVRAIARRTGVTTQVGEPQPMASANPWERSAVAYNWAATGRLALSLGEQTVLLALFDGSFELENVSLAPGENVLVARSAVVGTALVSPDSAPVNVTVSDVVRPDLTVSASGILTYPAVPVTARATTVSARVANAGASQASNVLVSMSILDQAGKAVLIREFTLDQVGPGQAQSVSVSWAPAAAGDYVLSVTADPMRQIDEVREDNNTATTRVSAVAVGGVVSLDLAADRTVYPASTAALVDVKVVNTGPSVSGTLKTTVEDSAGAVVVVLDERAASLDYADRLDLELTWNTGRTYAGSYAFRVRLVPDGGEEAAATDEVSFAIASDLTLAARLVPRQGRVTAGTTAVFDGRIANDGTNSPLLNATARLRLRPAGAPEPVVFEKTLTITTLLPGGLWTGAFDWPVSVGAGTYDAELTVFRPGGPVLATALATVEVTAGALSLAGTLTLQPAHILAGEGTDAALTITNRSSVAASAVPVAVDVADGPTASVLARATTTLDVAAGEARTTTVRIDTGGLLPGTYPVFLRAGEPGSTLDRAVLRVHGAITPPAIYAPVDGSRVTTSHPTLIVNNAASTEGVPLAYEFEIYANSELTMPLPGARDVAETVERTGWAVITNLGEDQTYYWRARATDGFSTSAWTAVASFTVDAEHVPPTAPVPESPSAGERVAVAAPTLVVTNSFDPDSAALSYEFRLATDPGMTAILASVADVPSGNGFTSWQIPITLEENASYYWCARARDESNVSLWSAVLPFVVDTTDEPPTAPVPLEPAFAARVTALSTPLVVENARDPEGRAPSYRFQIDSAPTFDSVDLQETSGVAEATERTTWTPPGALRDHTTYYWRASAFDGAGYGAWGASEFTVNEANEPPAAPVPLAPANGQVVVTLTPELRVRNASDPDRDVLSYEFRVTDEADREVASATEVEEGALETGWTLPSALVENGTYAWAARAHDSESAGPWTPPWSFRVNTVQVPPTAPILVAPSEGAVLGIRRPELVVGNAISPEGLPLRYTFELSRVALDGTLSVVERVGGIAEGVGTTSLTPSAELPDGSYSWTARAEDAVPGPWMEAAHFSVAVDQPPAPPTGLAAVPGDSEVSLTWNANPESDVVGYRVYRSLTSGGAYDFVAETIQVHYLDRGLENGVTVYYVVTAIDARFESERSAEVGAKPTAAGTIEADVRYLPDRIPGDCLLSDDCRRGGWHRRNEGPASVDGGQILRCGPGPGPEPEPGSGCPDWVKVAIELPVGHDAAGIDRSTVRLGGSVSADPAYFRLQDEDHDGRFELYLRFELDRVAPLLRVGPNQLSLTGRTATAEFRGVGDITVLPLEVALQLTPRMLHKRACGQDVVAHLSFRCAHPGRIDRRSLKLNGVVPAERVVSDHDHHLLVKFDRRQVTRTLPSGDHVRVEVSGTLDGVPFTAVDHIRVTE